VARDKRPGRCPHSGTAAAKSEAEKTQCSRSASDRRVWASFLRGCIRLTLQKIAKSAIFCRAGRSPPAGPPISRRRSPRSASPPQEAPGASFDVALSETEIQEARGASRGNAFRGSNNVISLSLRFGLRSMYFLTDFFADRRERATSKGASPVARRGARCRVIPRACALRLPGEAASAPRPAAAGERHRPWENRRAPAASRRRWPPTPCPAGAP
jgi:hypothetical protein